MARLSLALSLTALVVALLGATPLGNAAREAVLPRNSVGSEQVRDRSLRGRDFKQGQLPRGPAGPPGTIEGVVAGGDLTGTYPAPTLGAGSVESQAVADGSLLLADTAVLSGQTRVDLGRVKPHSCLAASAAVRGIRPYDRTLVLPTQNLPTGAFVTQIFNTGVPNRVLFRVCNATAKPLDPPLGGWAYVVWRQ
jgi:hypothetical protein